MPLSFSSPSYIFCKESRARLAGLIATHKSRFTGSYPALTVDWVTAHLSHPHWIENEQQRDDQSNKKSKPTKQSLFFAFLIFGSHRHSAGDLLLLRYEFEATRGGGVAHPNNPPIYAGSQGSLPIFNLSKVKFRNKHVWEGKHLKSYQWEAICPRWQY